MSRLGRLAIGFGVLTCALAAFILLPGCGQNPVAPDSSTYTFDNGLRGLKFADSLLNGDGGTALAKRTYSLEMAKDEVGMGPEGGLVRLDFNHGAGWLKVPEGALSENTTISAEALRLKTWWGHVTLFNFHPDGLVFNVPAILTLEVDDLEDGEWLHLFWYNPDAGKWEFQQRARVRKGKVSFEIHHFSKYGIS